MNLKLNPFAELTKEISEKVLAERHMKRLAEKRLEKLLSTYQKLVEDPRYKALYDELKIMMGDQLRSLVKRAEKCSNCAPYANRITILNSCIAEPLEMVWFEQSQEVLKEPLEEEFQEQN